MATLVIVDRSFSAELWRSLRTIMPVGLRDLIRGPVRRVALGDVAQGTKPRPLRRVDAVVGADLTLQRRIIVPAEARKDVAHAIELLIRTETPFAPEDLLVHALEDVGRQSDHQLAFMVRLVPRAPLETALAAYKLRKGNIDRLLIEGTDASEVDLASALFPIRRYTRWLGALPVVIVLLSLLAIGAGQLSHRNLQVAELETSVAQALTRVKLLTADAEASRQQRSGAAAALALLTEAPSAFAWLELVRQLLPNETELARIEIRAGEMRLAVKSPNTLGDAQRLATKPSLWSASVEGAITADPASNLEMATLLLRQNGAVPD